MHTSYNIVQSQVDRSGVWVIFWTLLLGGIIMYANGPSTLKSFKIVSHAEHAIGRYDHVLINHIVFGRTGERIGVIFTDTAGSQYSFISRVPYNDPALLQLSGKEVRVVYDRTNPQNASIDSVVELWGYPTGGFLIGVFLIIVGIKVGIKALK